MANKNVTESEKLHEQLNRIAEKIFVASEEDISVNYNFNEVFLKLYNQSIKDNYFWQFCPFKVYQSYFEERKNEFLNKNIDSSLIHFIENEKLEIFKNFDRHIIPFDEKRLNYEVEIDECFILNFINSKKLNISLRLKFLNPEIYKQLRYTFDRKLNFLKSKIEEFNNHTQVANTDKIIENDNNSYLNLSLNQFLDTITQKKITYEIKLDNGDIIQGTLSDFENIFSKANSETQKTLYPLLKNKKEYTTELELTSIEIHNYLEKITSNFDPEKIRIVLNDISVYYNMDFLERIQKESQTIYINENKEIPTIKRFVPILKKEVEIRDYNKMLQDTHPFIKYDILKVIYLLETKLKNSESKGTNKTTNYQENPHPRYFKDFESYSIFSALQNQIVREKYQLADYSFIYRKMKDEGLIYEGIKESEFREFLNREFQTELFEPLKTLLNCKTDHKMSVYSNLINSK